MGFQLQRKESIARAAKRLIRKELAQGRCELKSQELCVDVRVHEFRRRIKRVRALLRLIRDGLGSKAYRREDLLFSKLARQFSAVRDARACLDAFDSLAMSAEEPISDSERSKLRAALWTRLQCAQEQQDIDGSFETASRALRSTRCRVADWKINKVDWKLVGRGFRRVYAEGRRALQTMKDHPGGMNLHTLRKQSTYLRNIAEFLTPNRAFQLRGMLTDLHSLTEQAGKCLDLLLLRSVILQESIQAGDGHDIEPIIRRIDNQQAEHLASVVKNAERIYRRSPNRQLRRMKVQPIGS